MNPIMFLYNEVLFRPLFNLLAYLTNLLPGHNVGISIIIVTLIVRLILLPPSVHQARQLHHNQTKMNKLRDQLADIKRKFADDQTKRAQATMELYREAGINPASGCLPLLIQLPILIALYRVFLVGLGPETAQHLYTFISQPTAAQLHFLGIDLTQASLILAIAAGIFQFILMKRATPAAPPPTTEGNDDTAQMMASMQKNMAYIFPVMTVFISLQLPAALALYWVVSTLFGIVQQYWLKKYLKLDGAPPI